MRKKTYLLLAMLLITCSSIAQTNVSGFISANTTWNLAGSPYIVVGNTLLSSGYTLTIDPGVIVKFNDSTALQIDGELHAVGTAASRITFTSNQPIPAAGDWAKIHFADTCENAVFDASGNYLSGCIMKYCDVIYGGGLGFGEIHIESSSPYISQSNILNSGNAGIYCVGSTFILDSSAVKNNADFGLYFESYFQNSNILIIRGDTIANNTDGGLYLGTASGGTKKIINNYFLSNIYHGAISSTSGGNFTIADNYFFGNTGPEGTIKFSSGLANDTIRCNRFINNQMTNFSGAIYTPSNSTGRNVITNNLFDGNTTYNGSSVIYFTLAGGNGNHSLLFSDNTIINNISTTGHCCFFNSAFGINTNLSVSYNNFSNNTCPSVVKIGGPLINNSSINVIRLKHNNFLDPASPIEFYNSIPYGSPNIYADSNYWGSTSPQHIDSVIYDYFDYANYSVVYYSPILTSHIIVDTTCLPSIITSVTNIDRKIFSLGVYPNPFTTQATISFNKEVRDATFSLYNLLGEKVAEVSGISGESFLFNRGNLRSGVYVFEVSEGKSIWRGKAVVY